MRSDALQDATYRVYYVTLTGERYVYKLASRFKIQGDEVRVLDYPTGVLARYSPSGPLTLEKRRFLDSYLRGSYTHAVIERPCLAYLPRYAQRA